MSFINNAVARYARSARTALAAAVLFSAVSASAQTFTFTNDGSDYYVYFRWTSVWNACVWFPNTEYSFFRLYPTTLVTRAFYNYGGNIPANEGNDYFDTAGPGTNYAYGAEVHHRGGSSDYGYWYETTVQVSNIRAPGALTATTDVFDNKIVLRWVASTTDVPPDKYQYRIYRDGVLMATVSSSTLT